MGRAGLALALVRANGSGELTVGRLIERFGQSDLHRCYAATLPGVAQALIALRAYSLDRGELPPSLDALVPEYLAAVPIDAYDGAPLRYSRERKLLWSIGANPPDEGRAPLYYEQPSWKILF